MQLNHSGRHRHHLAATFFGLAAIMSLGCDEFTGPATPTTKTIVITVSTAGETIDLDADGYTLSIDGGPIQTVGINTTLTIETLSTGTHLVRLDGLAPNCTVNGTNPRSVDVALRAGISLPVPFYVSCIAKVGSIQVSAATSGSDQDPDGYSVSVTGVSAVALPLNGTVRIPGVREGAVEVRLNGVAGNCAVDAANPRMVDVTFGANVEVAFVIRCLPPGGLRVTTATTGVHLDPNGYDLEIRLEGSSSVIHTAAAANGTATISGLFPGNYLLTLFDVAPNCDVVMPSPRVVAVTSGSATPVTLDVSCAAPRELAYASIGGGNADIYIIAADGTGAYRITMQQGSNVDPAWSPDGSRIAFTSDRDADREIYVMNANGTNQVRLTNAYGPDYRPAWSPDGASIAFVSTRDGNAEIYLMNADGTNPVRLTSNPANDADPAWSPDGKRIAFSSGRDGAGGIWVMNADGSGQTRLTTNTLGDGQPAWSPDGTRIAFSRVSAGTSDIFIMNSDGSGLKQLTHGIENPADPSWSPDGRNIALGSTPGPCGWYDYYCDPYILVVSADGLQYYTLTTFAFNPTWRP